MEAYPIKFIPILKEKIWGGEKLRQMLNKNSNSKNIGESWEISGVEENISIVSNGLYKGHSINTLICKFKVDFLGYHNSKTFGENFPLLIKFLDAKTNLSVQVHPDDDMASAYHNAYGKTEMWYIMNSDKDAEIILGLKNDNTDNRVLSKIDASNVDAIFNTEKVKQGDSYFIPAGTIHAIGAGVLAAEIQQTSDITYRVYDWDRIDEKGHKRELHVDLAQKATKIFNPSAKSKYHLEHDKTSNLVDCNYFTTNIFQVNGSQIRNYKNLDSFVIYMCVEGMSEITVNNHKEYLTFGETVLIPANSDEVLFNSQSAKLLEIYIDSKVYKCEKLAC